MCLNCGLLTNLKLLSFSCVVITLSKGKDERLVCPETNKQTNSIQIFVFGQKKYIQIYEVEATRIWINVAHNIRLIK